MTMLKKHLHEMLTHNRLFCDYSFKAVKPEHAGQKLNANTASVGFLMRHVGEIMLLLGKYFGRESEVDNSTMGKIDEGQHTDIEGSKKLIAQGYRMLFDLVEETTEEEWAEAVSTSFFGTISKSRLFSHILYHNAYHAGQITLALKRGAPFNQPGKG